MKTMKHIPIVFSVILLNLIVVHAATGYRTHLFTRGAGIAAAGLGDSFTAGGDDMTVIHYNPSLLMTLDRSQIYGMHWVLFDTARYNFIGFSQLFEQSVFALSATQLYRDNIEIRQKIDDTPGLSSNSQIAIAGAYAKNWDKYNLNYALAVKYLRYSIAGSVATSFGGDFGISKGIYRTGSTASHLYTVNAGANLQNFFTTAMTMKQEDEKLPIALKLGLSASMTVFPRYNKKKDQFSCDQITLSPEITSSDSHAKPSFGVQYRLLDILFFRAGWNEKLTTGFGVVWDNIQFDYAYLPNDYTTLHKVGIIYKYGNEVERESQVFTEEYQNAYQKAQRIYQRYYRDAENMVELRNYQTAVDLLERTIPLLPKENSSAKALLENCRKAIMSESVGGLISTAKSYESSQDPVSAYRTYLSVFDVDPENGNTKVLMDTLYQSVLPSVQIQMSQLKSEYIQKISSSIEPLIARNDFKAIENHVKRVEIVAPDDPATTLLKNRMAELKNLYVNRLVSQGMIYLQDDKPKVAYGYFSEASRINPTDTIIMDQKRFAQSLYLKSRKSTLQDKLYAEKLYYLAATAFSTNDYQKTLENFNKLKSFNPVHDFIADLEIPLLEKGVIKKSSYEKE